jgi:hypothetical protein
MGKLVNNACISGSAEQDCDGTEAWRPCSSSPSTRCRSWLPTAARRSSLRHRIEIKIGKIPD